MCGFLIQYDSRRTAGMLLLVLLLSVSGCGLAPTKVPYPAFIQSEELEDVFLVGLPGVRAKQFGGDARSLRSSNRLLIPENWDFSTGAVPDKSVEIFVLAGQIELGDLTLGPGGYAYLPSGSMGTSMRSRTGAELLYFLDDVDASAVIQTPLISGIDPIRWRSLSDDPDDFGLSVLELRSDPGSGARTWLLKIDPVAAQPWQRFSADVEGFLVSGQYQHSECVSGEPATGTYKPGGYFLRPADAVHAGPEAKSIEPSIWYLRTLRAGEREIVGECASEE